MKKFIKTFEIPILVFLVMRVVITLLGVFSFSAVPGHHDAPAAGGYEQSKYSLGMDLLFGLWERSDSLWFFHIARDGYTVGTPDVVFFPLYPLLIKFVHTVTFLPYHLSGLLVSNLCLLGALCFLFSLVKLETSSEDVAKRTLWFQLLYPGSLFFFISYSESLFLLCAVASLYFARKREWIYAGIAGGLLSLTRHVGILVLLPLTVEWLSQQVSRASGSRFSATSNLRRRFLEGEWKTFLSLFIVPLFFSFYLIFLYFHSGDPLIWIKGHGNWNREPSFPWKTMIDGVVQGMTYVGGFPGGIYVIEAAAMLLGLSMGIYAFRVLPKSYFAFWLVLFLPALFSPYPGRVLMSYCRILAVAFPVFFALAISAKKEPVEMGIKLTFAGLMGIAIIMLVNNHGFF